MRTWLLSAVLVAFAAGGCATNGRYVDGLFTGPETSYRLPAPGESWFLSRDRTSDVSFRQTDRGGTLYVESTCAGFQDAPLRVLANHLFFNFDEVEVRNQQIFRLDGRDALERIARVRLDGADMGVAVTVIKKNSCVYDLVLLAPPSAFEGLLAEYRETVQRFEVVSSGRN